MAECREAIRLGPDHARPHVNLGRALHERGRYDEAIAAYREGIRLDPETAEGHQGLGAILSDQKRDYDGAIAEFRRVIALRPDIAHPHFCLGLTHQRKGEPDAAIAEYQEAIRLDPVDAQARFNLGDLLENAKDDHDAAIAALREAVRLRPDMPRAHYTLGQALARKGKSDAALAELRDAIRLAPGEAGFHYSLGHELSDRGDLDGAEASYRKAVRLDPEMAEAYCNLGHTLRRRGKLAEALAELRRGHELGSGRPDWSYPSAQWVAHCEHLVALDARFAAILRGEAKPADADERLGLADLGYQKRLYAASARFYAEAFADRPKLAEKNPLRYNAACTAALAGTGRGEDDLLPDDEARARWRRQALDWLRAELALRYRRLDNASPQARAEAVGRLKHWQADPDLAGLRDEPALAKLPEPERAACRALWSDVARLLKPPAP
jgi:Flp pilus assembly protein TadD